MLNRDLIKTLQDAPDRAKIYIWHQGGWVSVEERDITIDEDDGDIYISVTI